jgi:hypothetical protein
MSPVERIACIRSFCRIAAETRQRIIRSAVNDHRKFHPLLNNFIVPRRKLQRDRPIAGDRGPIATFAGCCLLVCVIPSIN